MSEPFSTEPFTNENILESFPTASISQNHLNEKILESKNLFTYNLKIIQKSILYSIDQLHSSTKHRFNLNDKEVCDEICEFLIIKEYRVSCKEISLQTFPQANEFGVAPLVYCTTKFLELEISW